MPKKFDPGRDYYRQLGVKPSATHPEIRKRFRELSRERHPDRTGDNGEAQRRLNEAFVVLGDPECRREYDAARRARRSRRRAANAPPPRPAPGGGHRGVPPDEADLESRIANAEERVARVWGPHLDIALGRARAQGGWAWGIAVLTGLLAFTDAWMTIQGLPHTDVE